MLECTTRIPSLSTLPTPSLSTLPIPSPSTLTQHPHSTPSLSTLPQYPHSAPSYHVIHATNKLCTSDAASPAASSPGSSLIDDREENHTSQTTSQSPENELLVPPTGEIKSTLLHHAETLILSVASQAEGGDVSVVVQCHLCLSELGLAMHTPTVAANSALAALRLIQEDGNENGNKEPVQ